MFENKVCRSRIVALHRRNRGEDMHKFRQKYIGDKAFYKRYLMLAIPMIIQNAITNLVSFLDNIMVGQLGTEQMSGVAIVKPAHICVQSGGVWSSVSGKYIRDTVFWQGKS